MYDLIVYVGFIFTLNAFPRNTDGNRRVNFFLEFISYILLTEL